MSAPGRLQRRGGISVHAPILALIARAVKSRLPAYPKEHLQLAFEITKFKNEENALGPPANAKEATPINAAALEGIQTRLSAYTNIKSPPLCVEEHPYGADGTGATDSTTAFQAAIAALPFGGLCVAATAGASTWIVICAGLTGGAFLWGFAPNIPGLRRFLSANRRISHLEALWLEGHRLAEKGPGVGWDTRQAWTKDCQDWSQQAEQWVAANLSPIDGERFRSPHIQPTRNEWAVDKVEAQLRELIRLRDDQLATLR